MLRIELRDRRLRLDIERRIEPHRPRLRCQRHHIGDVGAPEDAIGHQIVGDLGGLIDADDRDQGALAFRRLKGRDRGVGLFFAIGGAAPAAGAGGSERIQAPPIVARSAAAPRLLRNTSRLFMTIVLQ